MSLSEIQRRRSGDASKNTPADPDFPPSFIVGERMRVTKYEDAAAYVRILEARAKKGLLVPGRRPRGRPRRSEAIQAEGHGGGI
jgi:hypothetical protein